MSKQFIFIYTPYFMKILENINKKTYSLYAFVKIYQIGEYEHLFVYMEY